MFEDKPKTIIDLSRKGIYCVCIPQPWNKEIGAFAKGNSYVERIPWSEAVDWVDEVNKKFN
jgi:hypothetical protein